VVGQDNGKAMVLSGMGKQVAKMISIKHDGSTAKLIQGARWSGPKCLKVLHLWSHSQKIQNPKKFFHCRLKDLPSLLRAWTAL